MTTEEKAKAYAEKIIKNDYGISSKTFREAGFRFGYEDVVQAYLAGATEALALQWRSVEEELPEDATQCLVFLPGDYDDNIVRIAARKGGNRMNQTTTDKIYMAMADSIATASYANRLKVGAIIVKGNRVISEGFNGTPSGFPNVCEDENGDTFPYVLHAEANAITKLAKSTESSEGATIYVTYSPCIECAKLIIQSGIRRVVFREAYRNPAGVDLLREAGVEVECIGKEAEE